MGGRGMTAAERVEYLLGTVGPRITAAGCGLADARPLVAWRQGEPPRDGMVVARLDALCAVVEAVCVDYNGAVAASFLRGSNPDLDDESALLLIREAATEVNLARARTRIADAVRAFMD